MMHDTVSFYPASYLHIIQSLSEQEVIAVLASTSALVVFLPKINNTFFENTQIERIESESSSIMGIDEESIAGLTRRDRIETTCATINRENTVPGKRNFSNMKTKKKTYKVFTIAVNSIVCIVLLVILLGYHHMSQIVDTSYDTMSSGISSTSTSISKPDKAGTSNGTILSGSTINNTPNKVDTPHSTEHDMSSVSTSNDKAAKADISNDISDSTSNAKPYISHTSTSTTSNSNDIDTLNDTSSKSK